MKSVPLLLVGFLLVACASSPLAQFEERVRNNSARGYDFNQRNAEGQTLLHEMGEDAIFGSYDTARVRILLEAGLDPNARDNDGRMSLHFNWSDQQVAIQTLLIAFGADPNARNEWGWTPLHCCAHATGFRGLIAAGADPSARDGDGDTPLHMAANGRVEGLFVLLSAGADLEARNAAGRTPLHEAAHSYSTNYTDDARVGGPEAGILLLAGAEVNAADTLGRTPLHVAASWESPVHRVLLANGADPNARDTKGRTPLHEYAADYNRPRLVPDEFLDPLLAAGGDVNAPDRLGRSPLHLAREMGRIGALLASGANPAARDSTGATPLHLPWWSNRDQIGALTSRGVDVNDRDHAGRTPLHLAAARMNETRMTALLNLGAYATARDTLGATPLHYLARESGPETGTSAADILLRAGADPHARDDAGRAPLDYVEHRSPLWWRLNDLSVRGTATSSVLPENEPAGSGHARHGRVRVRVGHLRAGHGGTGSPTGAIELHVTHDRDGAMGRGVGVAIELVE